RETKKTNLLRGLPEKKAEAMTQLIDAIQALQRENKETLWGSMVKQTMIRKNPAFNESYYGFSTFSKLLEEAAKQRIVTLERDEHDGYEREPHRARQEPDDRREPAEALDARRRHGRRGRDVHLAEARDGLRQPPATEPAKDLLRAVREEDHAQDQPHDQA